MFDNSHLLAQMSAAAKRGDSGMETHPDYVRRGAPVTTPGALASLHKGDLVLYTPPQRLRGIFEYLGSTQFGRVLIREWGTQKPALKVERTELTIYYVAS